MNNYDLNSLRIQTSAASLEAFNTTDVKNLLLKAFPAIVGEVKSFFSMFTPDQPGISLEFNPSNFRKEIEKQQYTNIAPLAAYVPEGLGVSYLSYMKELLPAVEHAAKIMDVMNNYTMYLGTLINNRDAVFETKSMDSMFLVLNAEREKTLKEIGGCFINGVTKSEVTIGKVVDRNGDWEKVFKELDTMTLLINKVDRKVLNKKIKETSDMLDIIINKIKRDEFSNLTPQNIKNLSNGCYAVAKELEYFSVVYYRVLSLVTTVNMTVKHYETVMKK